MGNEEATAFGVAFTDQEVYRAAEWLAGKDLIKAGGGAWGMQHLMLPKITAEGIEAIDAAGLISDWVRSGAGSMTYQDNRTSIGDGAVIAGWAQGGQGHRFEVTQTITKDGRNEFADGLAAVVSRLTDEGERGDLTERLTALEHDARNEAVPKDSLGSRLLTAVAVAWTTEAAQWAVPALMDLAQYVGG